MKLSLKIISGRISSNFGKMSLLDLNLVIFGSIDGLIGYEGNKHRHI